jgi:hypothetical protein
VGHGHASGHHGVDLRGTDEDVSTDLFD